MEKNSSNFYFLFKKKDFTLSRGLLYISLIAATPEEATRGTWGRENVVDNPKSSVFSFKKIKIEGTTFFLSRGDIVSEVGCKVHSHKVTK